MKFHVLTLFPEIVQSFFETSIMAKAVQKGIIAYELVNIRDFAFDKHKTCDDTPYGGGAGMLMMPAPLDAALESVLGKKNTGKKAAKKLQLGLFRSKDNAAAFVEKIKKDGFNAYIQEETRESGTTYYLVFVDENAGGGTADKLKSAGYESYPVF